MTINKIQGQTNTCNATVCTFYGQYSLTDNSMWLFSACAILIASAPFWSRAKAKDSYSIHMIICESLSPKILKIINLELLTSLAPTNSFPSPLACLSRGTKISEFLVKGAISSRY